MPVRVARATVFVARAEKDSVIPSGWEVTAPERRYTAVSHRERKPRMRPVTRLHAPTLAAMLACASCVAAATAPTAPAATSSVTLRGHSISVEIADTPAEQSHGLMDRTAMAADHGMLFVFPDAEPRTFWMKNTLIPLDMLFFDDARRLVAIHERVPPCTADPCPLYASVEPARYVLELNAGTAARLGVRKGDAFTFSQPPSGTQ